MDVGAELRAARESQGLSLSRLSQQTRVPERTLAAIERNDASALPPHPFGRGFVRTYAAEVDLDPERLVRDYFSQFPGQLIETAPALRPELPDSSWQPQSMWMGLVTALTILGVVVAAALVLGRRSETPSEPAPVGTTGGTPPAAAPSANTPTAATPVAGATARSGSAVPQPAASRAPIAIVLSVNRLCWVSGRVDGKTTIYRTLQPGERVTLEGNTEVALRFGDAGAVAWTINGRDPGAPGADGAVRSVRITPANAGTVK